MEHDKVLERKGSGIRGQGPEGSKQYAVSRKQESRFQRDFRFAPARKSEARERGKREHQLNK